MRTEHAEKAASGLIEYIMISGVLMVLMVITVLTLTSGVVERPIDQLSEYTFIDIGNGISTRIVDLYVIVPDRSTSNCTISTIFDIPDEVAAKEYYVTIESGSSGDQIVVSRDNIERKVSLAGIGTTLGVAGSTTGHGLNRIIYNSTGYTL